MCALLIQQRPSFKMFANIVLMRNCWCNCHSTISTPDMIFEKLIHQHTWTKIGGLSTWVPGFQIHMCSAFFKAIFCNSYLRKAFTYWFSFTSSNVATTTCSITLCSSNGPTQNHIYTVDTTAHENLVLFMYNNYRKEKARNHTRTHFRIGQHFKIWKVNVHKVTKLHAAVFCYDSSQIHQTLTSTENTCKSILIPGPSSNGTS